jgi:hypothetical protein
MHKFLVVACLLALPLASAQYNYDDYDFTEVLAESTPDSVGFYDFTSWGIAETGDGNLIFRVGSADNSLGPVPGSIILRFTTGPVKAMGYDTAFAPTSQGAGDGAVPESCEAVSSTDVYCLVSYGVASAGIGSTMTGIQAASYAGSINDQAPDAWIANGATGTDYTLVGCTLKVQTDCPVIVDPADMEIPNFFSNETGQFAISQSMGGPFYGVYNYNFSVAALPAFFNYTVEALAGSVTFTIADAFDELAVITVESNFTDSLDLDGFEGDWTMSASFDGFVGNVTYGVDSPLVAAMESNETMDDDVDPGNETMEPEEETESTPGLAFPILAVGLVVLARRRL